MDAIAVAILVLAATIALATFVHVLDKTDERSGVWVRVLIAMREDAARLHQPRVIREDILTEGEAHNEPDRQ